MMVGITFHNSHQALTQIGPSHAFLELKAKGGFSTW
jgi:hypothetical protein